jgi:hypothetical protein
MGSRHCQHSALLNCREQQCWLHRRVQLSARGRKRAKTWYQRSQSTSESLEWINLF